MTESEKRPPGIILLKPLEFSLDHWWITHKSACLNGNPDSLKTPLDTVTAAAKLCAVAASDAARLPAQTRSALITLTWGLLAVRRAYSEMLRHGTTADMLLAMNEGIAAVVAMRQNVIELYQVLEKWKSKQQ